MYYRGSDKSLARPGRKQAWKYVRDVCDFNNIEARAVKFPPPPQGKAPNEIHNILTEKLACFLPGQAKDLPAPLCVNSAPVTFAINSPYNRPRRPRGGVEVYFYSFFYLSARWGWVVKCHTPAALPSRKNVVPIV